MKTRLGQTAHIVTTILMDMVLVTMVLVTMVLVTMVLMAIAQQDMKAMKPSTVMT